MALSEIYWQDVRDIQSIPIISTLLDVITNSTGMGFAAIARVTEEKWLTCGVLDKISFGLEPGDELVVESTLCHEVRQAKEVVVIDEVSSDPVYCKHHTPLQYGFESCISVPIFRKNGLFFGTLCAIDPNPHRLNNEKVIGMFTLFADLISFHLQAIETMQIKEVEASNKGMALAAYEFVASHNLQEPLRKIQMFTNDIEENDNKNLSARGAQQLKKINNAATKMRRILDDLIRYSEIGLREEGYLSVSLEEPLARAKYRLRRKLAETNCELTLGELCTIKMIPSQIEQFFYHILSNAINFRSPDRKLEVNIGSTIGKGINYNRTGLRKNVTYCVLSISDNGIGFEQKYHRKIFQMFQRLTSKNSKSSTGIGLTLAKRIVTNHNGKIFASGVVGKGAEFTIYLPICQ